MYIYNYTNNCMTQEWKTTAISPALPGSIVLTGKGQVGTG